MKEDVLIMLFSIQWSYQYIDFFMTDADILESRVADGRY